ncbi:M16 family metallopeptidase [Clostridium thermarum]|uniref:M16 family metallopeptidase n=1 Tax=Clostridium thermarum TaxID=1716543 RepID=UPI0011227AF1|nr:pitrilysin family protein [Clostridium thermarum]
MDYKIVDAKDIVLENGLRVVTIKKQTSIASIQCGVKIGALYESHEERGISHFIEHMLFKGTKNRDNESLNSALEFLGGEYNAYTDYTNTVYSVTVLAEETKNALSLLSDMLINSIFPEEEIAKEKDVIMAEYRSSSDDVEDYSYRMVNNYGFKNSPLKYDVIGTADSIAKFNREKAVNFYNKYYVPNNTVISVVSPMKHEEALEVIRKLFGAWQYKPVELIKPEHEKNIKIKKTTYKSNIEQCTITYLYTFYGLDKDKELALRILNHKFGESANSILFRELRENRGLAYDVYTHLDTNREIKTLYIYTAVKEASVKEALEVINSCIEQLKNGKILLDDEMLVLMKKVLKTAVASTLEDSTDLANYILHQCLDGENIYEFVEDMRKIQEIRKEDIYNVAREVFVDPAIHILKPKK